MVKAIKRGAALNPKKKPRSLLGLAKYYHHFFEIFLELLGPCPTCLRNGYRKGWMSLVTKSLGRLRASFFCHIHKHFEVHTEARDFAIGGCWCKMDGHCI